MKRTRGRVCSRVWPILVTIVAVGWCTPAWPGGYDRALHGVERLDVVFDVSHGNAASAEVIFWAVRDVYRSEAVRQLPEAPRVVVAFHGPAVRLLSTDRQGLKPDEAEAMDRFAATLKEMKAEGVTLEVCMYAVKVMGVDPASLLPEVDRVENGFVSVAGYQNQGYAVIAIP